MHLHPYVHIELARMRQQEIITKAERSRAALLRINLSRVEEPGLRRRGTLFDQFRVAIGGVDLHFVHQRDDPTQVEAGPR